MRLHVPDHRQAPNPLSHRSTWSGLPLRQALRAATAVSHRRLERRLPLTAANLSLSAYRAILQAFHGFYAPLEAALEPAVIAIPGLDWPRRRKAALLRRDLVALGLDPAAVDALPRCRPPPPDHHPASALGCLYVLEGATLGGQITGRLVARRLGLSAERGLAFLHAYGPATGAMWSGFIACLDEVGDPAGSDRAVHAGRVTFGALERWLERRGVLA